MPSSSRAPTTNSNAWESSWSAGKLKRADLELALKVMKETGESLGRALTEMGLTSARLFYEARLAFENGELERGKRSLETLLQRSPSFAGASELLVQMNDEIWKQSLPLDLRAKHKHRIGGCDGTLTLAAWGMSYSSEEHEGRWEFDDIRLMEMNSRRVLDLETRETEEMSSRVGRVLGGGTPERYKFELRTPIRDEDWSIYLRLAR